MFEDYDDDDDDDFDMDLGLSDPSIYDGQEDSPSKKLSVHPAVTDPVRPGLVSSNRKSHFSISALTDPEPVGESNRGPVIRPQLRHPETALTISQARREREEVQAAQKSREQPSSVAPTFKVPPNPKENQNRTRVSGGSGGGGGGSRPTGPTPANLVRKFPGPAGLIRPDQPCRPGDKRRVPPDPSEQLKRKMKKKPEKVREPEDFDKEKDLAECFTWRKALEELRALGQDLEVLQFNTDWIRSHTTAVGFKIPFFLGKIVRMDTEHKDPRVILLDDHGKIHGSVHRDILETYSLDIRPGTVLLVMKAAVLTTTGKKTYINITLNNLVAIYSHHHQVRSHQNVSVDQMRATAEEVERERVEEVQEGQEEERVTRQSALSPVMPSPCVNRSLQPSQAFSPMMRTVSREGQPCQSGGAFSPVFSTVGSQFSPDQSGYSPVNVNPQPARPPLLPSLSRNIQFNNSVRPSFPVVSRNLESNNTLSPVTPTVETRHWPGLTPGLPSLHLSPPSPSSPTPPTPPTPSPSVVGFDELFNVVLGDDQPWHLQVGGKFPQDGPQVWITDFLPAVLGLPEPHTGQVGQVITASRDTHVAELVEGEVVSLQAEHLGQVVSLVEDAIAGVEQLKYDLRTAEEREVAVLRHHHVSQAGHGEEGQLGVCFVRRHDAVHVPVPGSLDDLQGHFWCDVDTPLEVLLGLPPPALPQQRHRLLPVLGPRLPSLRFGVGLEDIW